MVVRIGENSARIIARRTITQDLIPAPHVDVVSGRPMMYCGHKQITADGYVTLNGETGDDASEWTAGFIQIEVSERNQAIYRGLHQGDGSLSFDRGGTARAVRICRDAHDANRVFYADGHHDQRFFTTTGPRRGARFPQQLWTAHFDSPGQAVNLIE